MALEYLGPLEKEVPEYIGPLEGKSDIEYVGPLEEKPLEVGEFGRKHPTLYGVGGAAKEVGKELSKISYLKYIYPGEREKFKKLSTQKQTRQLLVDNLELLLAVGGKRIGVGGAATVERYLPKTYAFLTKKLFGKTPVSSIEKAKKIVEGQAPKVLPLEAQKVEDMYNKATIAAKELKKKSKPSIKQTLKRAVVDVSGNVKKKLSKQGEEGQKAIMRHDLIAGAHTKAMKIVDDKSKIIYKDLSSQERETLNRLIQSRRTITIEGYKKIAHPEGLGAAEHQSWIDSLEPALRDKLNKRADVYFQTMKEQLDDLFKEGIINEESYASLVAKGDYSKRSFMQHIDPEKTYTFGGKKITVTDSGIKALAEGSEGLLEKESSLLMAEVVTRTQGRIFRNRANRSLFELAREDPENGVVRLAKVIGRTKEGKLIYQKSPARHETISVMINGTERQMIMPSELAKEWVLRDPAIDAQLANVISWLSGAKLLRAMATGYNPEFALTNFPRDIAHIWLTTQEYSHTLPVALPQMGRDLLKVLPDVIKRKGAWTDYINEGGGMEFLTHQGRIAKEGAQPLEAGFLRGLRNTLEYVGETSEILTRLALRERAIINKKSPQEATWIARNYLDFAQGGSFIKAADAGIPYLSAAVQGTRGIIRAAAEKPGVFT
ncbi:hypothetical protein LCGC14_2134950, partial [marine sediment metagenome]